MTTRNAGVLLHPTSLSGRYGIGDLDDWAMYAALKKRHGEARWTEWPHAIATRDSAAMSAAKKELATEIRYQKYIQFLFFRQWAGIREAADARGIDILGDVPIYVAA